MTSESLPDLQTIGPLPQTISFVLSGRRTLSEHLPAEAIDVSSLLVRRSKYLCRVVVEQGLTLPSTWQFRLPNVDPIGFRMYIEWLQTGHVEFHNTASIQAAAGLILRDAFDLVFAHIAGTQLEEPDYQDYVIDTMTELLDVSQTPDLRVLEVVFLENGASNVLKQFIVDKMFAVERRMLGMMRGRVEDAADGKRDTGCKYHVHDVGACYRDRFQDRFGNRANISHVSRQALHSNTRPNHSGRPSSMSTSMLSSGSLASLTPEFPSFSMAGAPYFGSVEWSREVHGLQRRDTTSDLHTDKPLPNIPPLTPGSSPTLPISPRSFPTTTPPTQHSCQAAGDSTQQLIFECLNRLPPTADKGSTRTESEPDIHRSQIPGLVLECLERFKISHGDGESSGTSPSTSGSSPHLNFQGDPLLILDEQSPTTSSRSSSPYPTSEQGIPTLLEKSVLPALTYPPFDRDPLPALREQDSSPISSSPASERSPSPTLQEHIPSQIPTPVLVQSPERRAHWEKSYDTLPKPWLGSTASINEPVESHNSYITQQESTQYYHQPLQPPERTNSTLIKRKMAPPRGTDWLKQYDKVNDMMKDTPIVVAKRSKRSRFKELLRSESRLGSLRLES